MEQNNLLDDQQVVMLANEAVKLALYKKKVTKSPIIIYDRKAKVIYNLKPDGTKEIISEIKTARRYSERFKKQ